MSNTFIALLRGINVSGQKKIKMADLRDSLQGAGLKNVSTYIQSGNIVFDSELTDNGELQNIIKETIQNNFGFDVPTLVVQEDSVREILKANPFVPEVEKNSLYYVLLKNVPTQELVAEFNTLQFQNEDYHITDTCVYLKCKKGYGNAKLNNNYIERKLKVEATTRNQKTMEKLLEMSASKD